MSSRLFQSNSFTICSQNNLEKSSFLLITSTQISEVFLYFCFTNQTQQLSMKYQTRKKALVLLADGTIFYGKSVGIEGTSTGEICFNTGMTGYQEIFTDPSYFGQLMVTTNAHIGNYGVNANEVESDGIKISGLICRNFSFTHSRIDSDGNLKDWFLEHNIVAISDVDTRALVSYIRDNGAMNAIISTEIDNIDLLKKQLAEVPSMVGLELASKVSTKEPYFVGDERSELKISVLDIGIKKNIINNLVKRGAYVKVFPFNSSFEELEAFQPDGYFISNGPGDPEPLIEAQAVAKEIIKNSTSKIILFHGDMGVGKTTLIKEICKTLGTEDLISSPTFSIVNEYITSNDETIFHFDFYRIDNEEEAYNIGVEDYFDSDAWCLIEWPSVIQNLLPLDYVNIHLSELDDGQRNIQLK